jgi:hypothetical protein
LERSFASHPCTTLSPTTQWKEPTGNLLSHKEMPLRAEERKVGG